MSASIRGIAISAAPALNATEAAVQAAKHASQRPGKPAESSSRLPSQQAGEVADTSDRLRVAFGV